MKNIIQPLKTITLALIIGLGIAYAMAWTGPTQGPPNGNVPAPVNVGPQGSGTPNGQYKSNYLGIGGLFVTDTETYLATKGGNVGIGTPNPTKKLDVAGSAKISGALGIGGALQADRAFITGGSWTKSTLNLYGRDVFTSNDEPLYLNYPNTSGDVEIGGEGETKTLHVKGNVRTDGSIISKSYIRGDKICIGGICKTSWPGGGGTLSGDTATMTLPGGSWIVLGWVRYFTCIDSFVSLNLDGVGVDYNPGHGDTQGCDHITLMGRKLIAAGKHTWSLGAYIGTSPSGRKFMWIAYKIN